MATQFAAVKFPAPNRLFEAMANAMERHLLASTINGQPVGNRCLGNVNDVFRSLGGSPRFLSPGFDQASDVASAMRSKANRTNAAPRGAICLWDSSGGSGDGHIAVADGQGNSVNNWSGTTIVRTELSQQRGGYVGWVSPALLGSGVDNTALDTNADYTAGGLGSEPSYPLPKPQERQPYSGISLPFVGSDNIRLVTDGYNPTKLAELIDSVSLDFSAETVAQLTIVSHDPDLRIASSPLARLNTQLVWQQSIWDVAAVDVAAFDGTVTIAARSRLARNLRRNYRVRTSRKVAPHEWVTKHVVGAGGSAICQQAPKRAEISQGDDQSEWDVIAALASDLGWSWVEFAGTVLFGSRIWALDGGPGLSHWAVTWKQDQRTDLFDAQLANTGDDPDNRATGTVVLPWERGVGIRPWHTIDLDGLGIWDGVWLVDAVSATTDGVSAVELAVSKPREKAATTTTSTESATRLGTPPKGGKLTVAYAQWFARQTMSRKPYNWADDANWSALKQLWTRESGWNYQAENPSSGAYGIPQCYSTDMVILTKRGWLKHDEVRVGDETVGYNEATKRSEWTKVTAVVHPGVHRVVRYGNSRVEFTTTPNHRWLMRGAYSGTESFVEIQNRRKRDTLILAKEHHAADGLPITLQEAALLGWIAGDGWERKAYKRYGLSNGGGTPGTFHIVQTKEENWSAIDDAVDGHGSVVRDRERTVRGELRKDREWRLSAPYARDLIERAGHPKTDHLAMVLAMSGLQRKAWLDAMFLAEGSTDSTHRSISQNEGPLAETIRLAVYLEGYRPSVYRRHDKRYGSVNMIVGFVPPTLGVRTPGFFYEDAGEQEVWCVTTELGSFTAEQNGHIHLTGNSLPGNKMASAGADWRTNPETQIKWGLGYIKGRYKTPARAWAHFQQNNWY